MSEKRMVIVSDRLMYKIDEYRGRLSRADFVSECIEKLLYGLELEPKIRAPIMERKHPEAGVAPGAVEGVSRQEFEQFRLNIDKLQQEFMDFFIKYGKHLTEETPSKEESERFNEELSRLLQL